MILCFAVLAVRLGFRVALVLFSAGAGVLLGQDAVAALPNQYRLVFENERVRVVHVRYGPHERLPVHKHPETPTVYVYLTDSGPVRFEHSEAVALVRRPIKAGTFFGAEAGFLAMYYPHEPTTEILTDVLAHVRGCHFLKRLRTLKRLTATLSGAWC